MLVGWRAFEVIEMNFASHRRLLYFCNHEFTPFQLFAQTIYKIKLPVSNEANFLQQTLS